MFCHMSHTDSWCMVMIHFSLNVFGIRRKYRFLCKINSVTLLVHSDYLPQVKMGNSRDWRRTRDSKQYIGSWEHVMTSMHVNVSNLPTDENVFAPCICCTGWVCARECVACDSRCT